MIPAAFEYVRPTSIDEAVAAVAAAGEDGKVLAGGQSLLPVLRLRLAYPETVIDIGRVPELRGVRDDVDAIVIGAMTTHHDVMHDALVNEHAPLIAQATATVADPQVRHRGTFGGALAHADPAGDLGAVALALGVELVATGPNGARTIPASDFFLDYLTTALAPGRGAHRDPRAQARRRAGPATTRSSTASRRRGRSWRSRRWSSARTGRSPRRGSG